MFCLSSSGGLCSTSCNYSNTLTTRVIAFHFILTSIENSSTACMVSPSQGARRCVLPPPAALPHYTPRAPSPTPVRLLRFPSIRQHLPPPSSIAHRPGRLLLGLAGHPPPLRLSIAHRPCRLLLGLAGDITKGRFRLAPSHCPSHAVPAWSPPPLAPCFLTCSART